MGCDEEGLPPQGATPRRQAASLSEAAASTSGKCRQASPAAAGMWGRHLSRRCRCPGRRLGVAVAVLASLGAVLRVSRGHRGPHSRRREFPASLSAVDCAAVLREGTVLSRVM